MKNYYYIYKSFKKVSMKNRKKFKGLMNEVVGMIFERENVGEMFLMDIKREIRKGEEVRVLDSWYSDGIWSFDSFDDRFERSVSGLENFEVKRKMVGKVMRRFLVKKVEEKVG